MKAYVAEMSCNQFLIDAATNNSLQSEYVVW